MATVDMESPGLAPPAAANGEMSFDVGVFRTYLSSLLGPG